jgi:50S ribosomal subunit-associated GTPase HflX
LIERISEFVARGTMTVDLRLPSARADLLARLHRDGIVREIQYDHDFTSVVATIPTRALEVFAAFLAPAVHNPGDEAAPAGRAQQSSLDHND